MLQTTYLIISFGSMGPCELTRLVQPLAHPLSLLPDSESQLPGLRTFDHSARTGSYRLS
jgi:hypothetical protein